MKEQWKFEFYEILKEGEMQTDIIEEKFKEDNSSYYDFLLDEIYNCQDSIEYGADIKVRCIMLLYKCTFDMKKRGKYLNKFMSHRLCDILQKIGSYDPQNDNPQKFNLYDYIKDFDRDQNQDPFEIEADAPEIFNTKELLFDLYRNVIYQWYQLNAHFGVSNKGTRETKFKIKYDTMQAEGVPIIELIQRTYGDNISTNNEDFFRIYFDLIGLGKRKLGLIVQKYKDQNQSCSQDINEIYDYFVELNEYPIIEKLNDMYFGHEKIKEQMLVKNEPPTTTIRRYLIQVFIDNNNFVKEYHNKISEQDDTKDFGLFIKAMKNIDEFKVIFNYETFEYDPNENFLEDKVVSQRENQDKQHPKPQSTERHEDATPTFDFSNVNKNVQSKTRSSISSVKGKLYVKPYKGEIYKKLDFWGKQRPYCKLSYKNIQKKGTASEEKESGNKKNVFFDQNDKYEYEINLLEEKNLRLEVYLKESIQSDKFAGECEIDLSQLKFGHQELECEFMVYTHKKEEFAKIFLKFEFHGENVQQHYAEPIDERQEYARNKHVQPKDVIPQRSHKEGVKSDKNDFNNNNELHYEKRNSKRNSEKEIHNKPDYGFHNTGQDNVIHDEPDYSQNEVTHTRKPEKPYEHSDAYNHKQKNPNHVANSYMIEEPKENNYRQPSSDRHQNPNRSYQNSDQEIHGTYINTHDSEKTLVEHGNHMHYVDKKPNSPELDRAIQEKNNEQKPHTYNSIMKYIMTDDKKGDTRKSIANYQNYIYNTNNPKQSTSIDYYEPKSQMLYPSTINKGSNQDVLQDKIDTIKYANDQRNHMKGNSQERNVNQESALFYSPNDEFDYKENGNFNKLNAKNAGAGTDMRESHLSNFYNDSRNKGFSLHGTSNIGDYSPLEYSTKQDTVKVDPRRQEFSRQGGHNKPRANQNYINHIENNRYNKAELTSDGPDFDNNQLNFHPNRNLGRDEKPMYMSVNDRNNLRGFPNNEMLNSQNGPHMALSKYQLPNQVPMSWDQNLQSSPEQARSKQMPPQENPDYTQKLKDLEFYKNGYQQLQSENDILKARKNEEDVSIMAIKKLSEENFLLKRHSDILKYDLHVLQDTFKKEDPIKNQGKNIDILATSTQDENCMKNNIELSKLKAEMMDYESRINEVLAISRHNKEDYTGQLNDYTKQIKNLQNKLTNQTIDVNYKENKIDADKRELDVERTDMNINNQKLQNEIHAKDREIEFIKSEQQDEKMLADDLKHHLNDTNDKINKLSQEKYTLRQEKDKVVKLFNSFQAKLPENLLVGLELDTELISEMDQNKFTVSKPSKLQLSRSNKLKRADRLNTSINKEGLSFMDSKVDDHLRNTNNLSYIRDDFASPIRSEYMLGTEKNNSLRVSQKRQLCPFEELKFHSEKSKEQYFNANTLQNSMFTNIFENQAIRFDVQCQLIKTQDMKKTLLQVNCNIISVTSSKIKDLNLQLFSDNNLQIWTSDVEKLTWESEQIQNKLEILHTAKVDILSAGSILSFPIRVQAFNTPFRIPSMKISYNLWENQEIDKQVFMTPLPVMPYNMLQFREEPRKIILKTQQFVENEITIDQNRFASNVEVMRKCFPHMYHYTDSKNKLNYQKPFKFVPEDFEYLLNIIHLSDYTLLLRIEYVESSSYVKAKYILDAYYKLISV